jgi:hypothetical protein
MPAQEEVIYSLTLSPLLALSSIIALQESISQANSSDNGKQIFDRGDDKYR